MADETTTETQSSNFRSMGGAGPASPDGQLAELDAIQSRAGAAANRAAGGRQESGIGQSVSQADSDVMAAIEEAMTAAEIAANSQRDIEAQGLDPFGVEDLDEGDDEGDEGDLGEELEDDTAAAEPTEQPRYSRRDAARLANELEQHKQALQAIAAADERILRHVVEQGGLTSDKYDALAHKVLSGTATRAEQEQVQQMRSWREFARPLYAVGQQDGVAQGKAQVGNDLGKQLDVVLQRVQQAGATAEQLAQIKKAPTLDKFIDAVLSVQAQRKRPASPAPSTQGRAVAPTRAHTPIARSREADADNRAPNVAFLKRALGADGLPNPDFDLQVKAGKFLGVDLTKLK